MMCHNSLFSFAKIGLSFFFFSSSFPSAFSQCFRLATSHSSNNSRDLKWNEQIRAEQGFANPLFGEALS